MSLSNTTTKHYIGIDPSINSTGIAILSLDNGEINRRTTVITPDKKVPKYVRMVHAQRIAEKFFIDFTSIGVVKYACIEGPSHLSQGMHDDLGQIRGILKLTITKLFGLYPLQVPPTSLKKFAASGSAKKEKMIAKAVEAGWDVANKSDDAADAAHLAMLAEACVSFREMHLLRKQLEVLSTLGVSLK